MLISHRMEYSNQRFVLDWVLYIKLGVLDGGKCILQIRGVRPFLSKKYDITQHPNYKYLSDYDKRNEFSIEKFLSTKLTPKEDEVYDTYEVDVSEQTPAAS